MIICLYNWYHEVIFELKGLSRSFGDSVNTSSPLLVIIAWSRSTHAKQVDVALYESCCLIIGCLKNIPIRKNVPPSLLPLLTSTWESWLTGKEWNKNTVSYIHPMFEISPLTARLKSRKTFLKCTKILEKNQDQNGSTDRNSPSTRRLRSRWYRPNTYLQGTI